MKKNIILLLILSLVLSLVLSLAVGCSNNSENTIEDKESAEISENEEVVLKVGATPVPHGELLNLVKDDLAKEGIKLEVIEFTDYVKPNLSLDDKEIDANFFQHVPYLDNFNEEHNLNLVSVATIHVEPLGLYSEKLENIDNLSNESTIAIPADSVNGARALILLENNGLIKLAEDAGLNATELDVVENTKKLKFKPIEAAQIPRILPDVDAAIINGNYAIEAGLNPIEDSLLLEGSESPYANIITTREDNKDDKNIKALVNALKQDKVKNYILENYNGGVVPAF